MTILLCLLACLAAGCVSANEIIPVASAHVLFLTTAASLWALGRFATFMAPPAESHWFWRLFRRTLPWHPVFSGAAIGFLFPQVLPADVSAGRVAAALYFAGSGVLATYGHDVFRTWSKYRNQQ